MHDPISTFSRKARIGSLALVLLAVTSTLALTAAPAVAAGPACPGSNPYLNDGNPTPTCAVMSPPLTLENRQPGVIATTPAYGWNPPMCYFLSHRWDGQYNGSLVQAWGTVTASARVVENWDGVCGGPTVPITVTITVIPGFLNVYGVGGYYGTSCRPGAVGSGAVTATSNSAACAGHTYAGVIDDWERGYYSLSVQYVTPYNSWTVASTHQVY